MLGINDSVLDKGVKWVCVFPSGEKNIENHRCLSFCKRKNGVYIVVVVPMTKNESDVWWENAEKVVGKVIGTGDVGDESDKKGS